MSEPFFYFSNLAAAGDRATLTGEEAQHAVGARRLRAGDALVLFDGRGLTARATLVAVRERGRALDLRLGEHPAHRPPPPPIHLACALPKGDRLSTLLDMATQLGMSTFTPLDCTHSVVQASPSNLARMHRVCLEACKQSRRAWLPAIAPVANVATVTTNVQDPGARLVIAQPGGLSWSAFGHEPGQPVTILVGPEGGFSEQELAQARAAGAQAIGLGDAILRIETAAVTLLALASRVGVS